jgi:hypothetical protein
MRTTVTLDADVVAAIEELQRTQSLNFDEALNRLVRAGTPAVSEGKPWLRPARNLGPPKLKIECIGELLEQLEGPYYK